MSLKSFEKKLFHKYFNTYRVVLYAKTYKKFCKICGVDAHKKAIGEDAWIEKWSGFEVKPNPLYYRLFSKFCGPDSRIVPEDICRSVIEVALNPPRFSKFYADKNMYTKLFGEKVTPKTVLRRMQGFYYDHGYNYIEKVSDDELYGRLDEFLVDKFIIKPSIDNNSGHGFHTICKQNGKYYLDDTREEVTMSLLEEKDGNNFIIQPFMKQLDEMNNFCSTSVVPIRIETYRSVVDDKVHVLEGGVLRIGMEGESSDGTHGNGVTVGINNDGSLMHHAVNYKGEIFEKFNGIDFTQNYVIPNFEQIKELAINVAMNVPHQRLLAFDIMLGDDGTPIMFEFNVEAYSMWLAQFVGITGFGEFTDEILDYCRQHASELEMCRLY